MQVDASTMMKYIQYTVQSLICKLVMCVGGSFGFFDLFVFYIVVMIYAEETGMDLTDSFMSSGSFFLRFAELLITANTTQHFVFWTLLDER